MLEPHTKLPAYQWCKRVVEVAWVAVALQYQQPISVQTDSPYKYLVFLLKEMTHSLSSTRFFLQQKGQTMKIYGKGRKI